MQLDLSRYINENFDVIYQSNQLIDIADADEFFLAEQHDDETVINANATFINTFKNEKSILFQEGMPSLEMIADDNQHLSYKGIESKDITRFGWDLKDKEAYDLISIKLDVANSLFECLRSALNNMPLVQELPRDLYLFYNSGFVFRKCIATKLYEESLLRSNFQQRTSSMNETVRGLGELRKKYNLTGKAFFIAGLIHLEKQSNKDEYCLQSFYEELRQRKAIVIKAKCFDKDSSDPFRYLPPLFQRLELYRLPDRFEPLFIALS